MKRFHFARVNESGLTLEAMSATIRMGEVIKIGSHAQCAICVKDDTNVFLMHATIELVEGRGGDSLAYKINNCGVDPTLLRVNNVPVDRSFRLEVGDVIRVGKTLLRLDAIDDAEDKSVSPSQVRELPDDLSEVLNKVVAFLGLPKPDGSWTDMALAFAKWLAFAQAFVADPDGQHQATWTETMLRVVGTRGMMKGGAEAVEACEVADAVLREKVKRFPPRMVGYGGEEDVGDDSPGRVAEMSWQDAALARAEELEKVRSELRQWREATGCDSLEAFDTSANEHNAAMQKTYAELTDLEEQIDAWRQATGCGDPETAKSIIVELHNSFAKEHEKRRANIHSATDDRVAREQESAALRVQIINWQNATNRSTPEEAHELIGDIKHKWELEILKCVDVTNERNIARRTAELAGEKLTRWRMVTGYEDPGAYKNCLEREANLANVHDRMIAERDRELCDWRNATGHEKPEQYVDEAKRTSDAIARGVAMVAERDELILEYAKEIDRLRKSERQAQLDCKQDEDTIDRIRDAFGNKSVDRICEIGKTALIPLPKPDKVEAGQKWALLNTVRRVTDKAVVLMTGEAPHDHYMQSTSGEMIQNPNMIMVA